MYTYAFPRLQMNTHIMLLLAVYRICDYITADVSSDVSGGVKVS